MSTWQIFSDDGTTFRWEPSPSDLRIAKHCIKNQLNLTPLRFASFEDVLIQGLPKISESRDKSNVDESKTPMFRTAMGNSVVLKKSCIDKASSVLGDDYRDNYVGRSCFPGSGFSSPNSMFQTGSGKMVNISSAGLTRAKALLGMDESSDVSDLQSFQPANKKFRGSDISGCEKLSREVGLNSMISESSTFFTNEPLHLKTNLTGNELHHEDVKFVKPEMFNSSSKSSAIKFNTAGGRSISVSSDALQRARSLLGDQEMGGFLDEDGAGDSMFSFFKNDNGDGKPCNSDGKFFRRSNISDSSQTYHQFERSEPNPKIFVSPLRSSFQRKHVEGKSETMLLGTNLLSRFDAEEHTNKSNGITSCLEKPLSEEVSTRNTEMQLCMSEGLSSGAHRFKRPLGGALADITNFTGIDSANKKGATAELSRLGRRTSVSPFKRPRSSKFTNPLNSKLSSAPTEISSRASEASHPRKRMSTHYPFQHSRTYMKDFFKEPPVHPKMLEEIPVQVRLINPENSKDFMFSDGSRLIGVEAFYNMLVQSGASMQHASKEWVANHYKWIVWKLASYERCYSAKFMRKFLTVSNVLDELNYRYEREVNHGHRSAIKRVLEGDASPSSLLVLCISAIHSDSESEIPKMDGVGKTSISRVELTDGWYSIDGQLDLLLSKHLAVGQLFVGQKLRICGASLNGWSGPVSPLEASSGITLLLHINGTYRACWADRLGFCRGLCAPLAFRCVKSNGGPIPRTLVGVTRIYPVLYRERLKNGRCIVRSEKMEAALEQCYKQKCSNLIEGITSDFQRGTSASVLDDYDNEGARIMKMLENAAEPELLMAEMSSEQLASFAAYQAKLEASRQVDLHKLIKKALQDAGLSAREVTPFMRVRVVGLKSYGRYEVKGPREGLITIWNPTERQKLELVEGQAYTISGLIPLHSDVNMLYLQARGSSTKWQPLTTKEKESFVPFFKPRKPVLLSRIGEIPLSSEFDTAVMVLHVGLEYIDGRQKRQWVFVTDGSLCKLQTEETTVSLLAISFCSPCTEDDSISPINYNLVGSIVGFCNLVKRTKDHVNHMWVAEATENSTYYLNCDHSYCSHLKHAFALVQKWQQSSSGTIEKLREKVLHIVGSKG